MYVWFQKRSSYSTVKCRKSAIPKNVRPWTLSTGWTLLDPTQLGNGSEWRTLHSTLTFRLLFLLLNNRYLANLSARPILVPPLGYLMRLIAYKTSCLFLKRLKLNTSHAREANKTTPTRVCLGEMWKDATTRLTKLRHRRKFPRPYASILPDPSIKKAKSRRLRHTENKKGLVLFKKS